MRKRNDIGINSDDTCGSCPSILEVGDSIFCPICNENYCKSCSVGGKSGLFGTLGRAFLGLYTLGISELIRSNRIRCPRCKNKNGLIRV
jgi:hypothetical protein